MTPAQTIVLNAVAKFPGQTALELWITIKNLVETADDRRLIRKEFFEEDQQIRVILRALEKAGKVRHTIRKDSTLKEWRAA